MFKIGHSAYCGANALAMAKSKAEAVRILVERGVKRDHARAAIDMALVGNGYVVSYGDRGPVEIQVTDMPSYQNRIKKEREIINRNPDLALDLFEEHKRQHGYAPYRDTLVRNLLLVKQGVYRRPVPREIGVQVRV